ncbi:MAG: DUF448 domain-containing protein [Acetobacteraceae bacterium]
MLTRTVAPKEAMVRFVTGPGRTLVPDLEGWLPGRGIWLSAKGDVIETARASGRLERAVARAAGSAVTIPDDLLVRLQAGLVRRIVGLLGRARRARQAVAGGNAASDWLAEGRPWLCVRGLRVQADETGLLPAGTEPLPLSVPAEVLAEVFGAAAAGPVLLRSGRLAAAVRCEVERLVGLGLGWSKLGRDERVHDGRQ